MADGEEKFDWRSKLDTDNSIKLNALVAQVSKFEHVYRNAENPQMIQLWLAMLEIYKRQDAISRRLDALEKKLFVSEEKKYSGIVGDLENY